MTFSFIDMLMLLFILRFGKQIRYASHSARADTRRRVKGRFVKVVEAYDYDPLATKSFWAQTADHFSLFCFAKILMYSTIKNYSKLSKSFISEETERTEICKRKLAI